MKESIANDILQSGTGFMLSLSDAIRKLEHADYKENLVSHYDHLECRMGEIILSPDEIIIDKMMRFENTSDPDDQSVLFAISSPAKGVKGLYVDSYGIYHESLSPEMLRCLAQR